MRANSILDTIGNTPHVRINRLFPSRVEVWMKLERANPGGSIKDRIGLAMVESRDGTPIDQKWIDASTWEVDIAGTVYPAIASQKPLFDPENKKIKG